MASDYEIEKLFMDYSRDVYQFLIYWTGTPDVEDLVQEVFIRAIKAYDHFQGRSSPKTWLLSIAKNLARDEQRKKKWKRMLPFEEKYEEESAHTPEMILQSNEETQELYHAIRRLKPTYRDVIILRGIKELSVRETASVLNWSEDKVGVTYHRARKALARALRRQDSSEHEPI